MTTKPVVGIPRALLYYEYGLVWRRFLEALGAAVLVSGPTTSSTIDAGVRTAIDEVCLPVKVAYGHCLELADSVPYLLVPRVVSVEPRAYSCPKLLGLPDMIRLAVPQAVRVLAPLIDISGGGERTLRRAATEVGGALGAAPGQIRQATRVLTRGLRQSVYSEFMMHAWRSSGSRLSEVSGVGQSAQALARRVGMVPARPEPLPHGSAPGAAQDGLLVGLLGHSYNLYDPGLNLDLLAKLTKLGVAVKTPEDYRPAKLEAVARAVLRKPLFWTLGRRLIAAAHLMAADRQIAGIIAVESFGCGPDSMVVDLAMRSVGWDWPELPFMELTLDEHTGEAGFVTRLEAFVDLLDRRKAG